MKAFEPAKAKMRNFLSNEREDGDRDMMGECDDDRPIADLFPETTIMFADIAGFTAWSSVREPSQVFTLLEKIYGKHICRGHYRSNEWPILTFLSYSSNGRGL